MEGTVILIGPTSGLAQSLIPVLKREYKVITAGRSEADFKLDLCSLPSCIKFFNEASLVINCASDFGYLNNDQIINEVNINSPSKLYKNCLKSGVSHFIHISSMAASFKPSSPLYTRYSKSKLKSEELLLDNENAGLTSLTIFRPSQLYGSKIGQLKHRSFLRVAFEKVSIGEPLPIYGNKDALRNYLSFDNFSEIILKACLKKVSGRITCTAKDDSCFSDIAKKVCDSLASNHNFFFLRNKEDLIDVVAPYPYEFYESISYHPKDDMDKIFNKIAKIYK